MAEKQKSWLSDKGANAWLGVFCYGLFFLGWYFYIAYFFPAVSIFSFASDFLPLCGFIFVNLGTAYYLGVKNLVLLDKLADALGGTSDNVGRVVDLVGRVVEMLPLVDSLQSDEEKTGKRNRTQAAMDALRRELKESSELRIKETEVRLKGEWRFVVGLMVAILFGFLTLFLAVRN